MRIISGEYGGRRITAPKGRVARPTAERTRESIFNKLSAREDVEFVGARVIDLFAGSGALGLEAMSRGAAYCLFVETDAGSRGAIRDNIEALGLYGATRLHRRSAASLGNRPANIAEPFSLAFLDPPYRAGLAAPALDGLVNGGWLIRDALIVLEHAADEETPAPALLTIEDRRSYGAAAVALYKYRGG
ncbi:MAG: 16S rRNA (guanine(966)-N(2))-methyltransferase RsmD [Pseudomonadota bacterium]